MPSRRGRKFAALLAGCGLSLVLAELGLRACAPQLPSWLAIYRAHPALPFYALEPNASVTVDAGESTWTVCTDAQGFRVGCAAQASSDPHPVLWLGDSFSFGHGVNFEESFVGLLANDPRCHSHQANTSVPGYGPVQYRQTLEYLLGSGLQPRAVLVCTYLGNDFFDCIWSKNLPIRNGVLGDEGGWKAFAKEHSHLYRLISARLHKWRPPPFAQAGLDAQMADEQSWIQGDLQRAEQVYREEFARISKLCVEHAIPLAVLVIPRSTLIDALAKGTATYAGDKSGLTRAWEHAQGVLHGLGLRVLDLTPVLVPEPVSRTFLYTDGHLSPRGNALVAEALRREFGDLFDLR